MAKVAVFDMNETTLDLAPVRAALNRLMGTNHGFTIWFQKLLQLAMTSVATDNYQNFSVLAPSALSTVAESLGVTLGEDAGPQVAEAMAGIDPFPDVVDGLTSLRADGWTTVALTNSAAAGVNAQVDRTGLRPLFDHVASVDEVGVFKPSPLVYQHATTLTGAPASAMWMVASHDWDLAGARATGMHTAFVGRPHMTYAPSFPRPDVSVANFVELADALAGFEGS